MRQAQYALIGIYQAGKSQREAAAILNTSVAGIAQASARLERLGYIEPLERDTDGDRHWKVRHQTDLQSL